MANRMTIGVDFGGSSSKATLLDESGTILATSTQEYPSYYPYPGWLEQAPQDFYDSFVYNVKRVLEKSGVMGSQIMAISLDAATHMAVFADENDKPIRNIIHWSDSRCSAQVKWLKEHHGELLSRDTYNSVSPAWTLPQILWLMTSAIALLECVVSYTMDDLHWSRVKSVFLLGVLIFLLGVPSSLSFGPLGDMLIFNYTFFDFMGVLTDNFLMPLGGIAMCVYVGWIWGPQRLLAHIESDGVSFKLKKAWLWCIRIITPVLIVIVMAMGIVGIARVVGG